jgi:hypothetical protein
MVTLAGSLPVGAAAFMEDFESGLNQWTGKAGGSHSGVIVADPLNSGRGNVLSFSNLAYGGDIFTTQIFSISGPVVISFEYLGLAKPGSVPGDLGGFLGIARQLDPGPTGEGNIWYAGTQDDYPDLTVLLVDDGAWHRYEFVLDGAAVGCFHLILEDFGGSGGISGDAYFDNISVAVPEPTMGGLVMIGAFVSLAARRCRK